MKLTEKYVIETSKEETKPGCWNHLLVHIFQCDEKGNRTKIGEYKRNYSTLYDTFKPFVQGGKEYALYSKDYQTTSVMSLPDCKHICDEKSPGFCPTGYYVLGDPHGLSNDDEGRTCVKRDNKDDEGVDGNVMELSFVYNREEKDDEGNVTKKSYCSFDFDNLGMFGFVSGCYWGDDSSWKIQFLDLSRITEGILTNDSRFGYIELPENVSLKDAITIHVERHSDDKQDVTKSPFGVYDVTIANTNYFKIDKETVARHFFETPYEDLDTFIEKTYYFLKKHSDDPEAQVLLEQLRIEQEIDKQLKWKRERQEYLAKKEKE